MSTQSSFQPRGTWSRIRRGAIVAACMTGILFFFMRDSVAHKIVQTDTGTPGAESGGELIPMPGQVPDQMQGSKLPEQWMTDFNAAKAKARETEKPLLAVFSAEWCGPCQMMVRNIYPTQPVINALNDWVPVYIDGDDHPDIVAQHRVQGFPTFVIFSPEGEEKGRFVGGAGTPQAFLARLETAVDYEEKLAAARSAVEENPDNAAALHRLGDLKMAAVDDSESFMEAADVYKRALAADPDNLGNIEPELAAMLIKSVKSEQQVAAVTEQIEQSPDNAKLYKKRGDLHADNPLLEDSTRAIADYRKAVELDPDNETGAAGELTFHQIRNSLSDPQGDPTAAANDLAQFEQDNPDSPRVPDSIILRAFINLQTGRMEQGAEALELLVEKFPEHDAAGSARELLAEIRSQSMGRPGGMQ